MRGSHFIYSHPTVVEIINIQAGAGGKAKPYQVKQVRDIITHYGLRIWADMLKYEVIIYWSQVDEAFIAHVSELPGCMADGATQAKALRAVERVAREWILAAKELGRSIPKPRGRLAYA